MAGSSSGRRPGPPLWLLAELTYSCPLQCPYCSNPLDIADYRDELATDDWLRVLREARKMGAVQLGFSGGEPLVRRDLETLIAEADRLGYYTNLITSGIGMDRQRIAAFKRAGLAHIQISFQASDEPLNDALAGTAAFRHKLEMAREVKRQGYPMVLCFVLHRHNTDRIRDMLDLAAELEADYVELATTQYYGWAHHNREWLLPTREQVSRAERIVHEHRERVRGRQRIFYVVPDYFEDRPKPCMNGWGNVFLTIAPDGTALPCHSARLIPGLTLPNVKDHGVDWIWNESPDFNRFRGFEWMREPCRSCDEKDRDFGGCRCQALMLTGDAANADPVCSKSPHHAQLIDEVDRISRNAEQNRGQQRLLFRNVRVSRERFGHTEN